ncbi:hypothetical protein ND861_07035 [Leptospira sp. 2 VSF19]|uniref:DUF559 domain-containing protein n=1 Tax=Leptospira soteropolitanensis TaxID=2950025 RepID=A0AAW5VJJ2_9LEPT|nr:hypothetical protein [Leptospira soteropolitanensis]MCW7499985.1 hypothetical protein [Leptospira soteropolitanensis]MCW7526092.1 hypothetical protein [Leptospira soteropolitanensis]MCW7529796.1 hypothetical protein [Leptospira soteropolitanensis]
MGYKRIGEGNIQEHNLYRELTKVIDPSKIKRWYRPKWLGGLELDFYFELDGKRYGIEYQGAQHVRPTDFFGGKKSFKKQIRRDVIKLNLCHNNGVKLLHCYFDEQIQNFINQKLLPHLR